MTVFPNPYEAKPNILVRIGFLGRGMAGGLIGSGIAIALSIGWHASWQFFLLSAFTGAVVGSVNRSPIPLGLIVWVLSMFLLKISFVLTEYGPAMIQGYHLVGLVIGATWALIQRWLGDNDN